jgi:hypothetical protein
MYLGFELPWGNILYHKVYTQLCYTFPNKGDMMFSSFTVKEANNCCSPQPKGKAACPVCKAKAKSVLGKTLQHLLREDIKMQLSCLEGFHFCKTPTCPVVYFRDEKTLTQENIKVVVGCKEGAVPAMVCYCFAWTKEKIASQLKATGKTDALEDIKAKMQDPGCSCEILNPSGGCCLGDVTQAIKEIKAQVK